MTIDKFSVEKATHDWCLVDTDTGMIVKNGTKEECDIALNKLRTQMFHCVRVGEGVNIDYREGLDLDAAYELLKKPNTKLML